MRRETAPPTRSPARAAPSTFSQRCAARSAERSAAGEWASALSPLTSFPVSMPSGQAIAQVPSAAQVSSPSYSKSSSNARATAEPGGWRAISRRRTIRSRGVVVSARLGQTGSHIPHSTQAVTDSSTGGVDLRSRRWAPGSRLSRIPGARMPSGSASCFTLHIISVALAPHSRSTKGAMLRPVPCSAFSEPSYLPTISSTRSAMNSS